MENSAEFYYNKLKDNPSPGNVLASLYCVLYDINITRSEIILFNKLLKVFDRFMVFFSILDMAGSYPNNTENPYPLLYTICKRRFEAQHVDSNLQSRESLEGFIRNLNREIEKISSKKLKIPSSKGLEPDDG